MEIISILDSIKQMLGIDPADTSFDSELIIFINSSLSTVNKLGVGPDGFKITDNTKTWPEFIGDRTDLEEVKTNVYLRVRLVFDPPQSSFAITAIKEQITEGTFYIELYHKKQIPIEEVIE